MSELSVSSNNQNTPCVCATQDNYVGKNLSNKKIFSTYCEGDELYAAMLTAISNAKKSVYLESYIFALDEIGTQFLSALQDKAAEGIDVRLHIDSAGSRRWLFGRLFKRVRASGVKLKWFHRWSWKNPLQFNVRNHRKILIVDGELAFIGGFNIHNESSLKRVGASRWLDFHVAIADPYAKEMNNFFTEFWNGSRQYHPDSQASDVFLLPNFSQKCRFRLRCEIGKMLSAAKDHIQVSTPYFVPDSFLLRRLIEAAKRGVKVKLMVPKISDNRIVDWAARNYYTQLLLAGIEVYEYQPRMLHGKLLLIDNHKAMVGSANVDYRSLYVNFELVLITSNDILVLELSQHFSSAKDDCLPISTAHWQHIAWKWRALSLLGYLLRRLL